MFGRSKTYYKDILMLTKNTVMEKMAIFFPKIVKKSLFLGQKPPKTPKIPYFGLKSVSRIEKKCGFVKNSLLKWSSLVW